MAFEDTLQKGMLQYRLASLRDPVLLA